VWWQGRAGGARDQGGGGGARAEEVLRMGVGACQHGSPVNMDRLSTWIACQHGSPVNMANMSAYCSDDTQSSIVSPSIRLNSLVLCVTRTQLSESA